MKNISLVINTARYAEFTKWEGREVEEEPSLGITILRRSRLDKWGGSI